MVVIAIGYELSIAVDSEGAAHARGMQFEITTATTKLGRKVVWINRG